MIRNKQGDVILTDAILTAGKSARGGWSKAQRRLLGVTLLTKGWKQRLQGTWHSLEAIVQFVALKNEGKKPSSSSWRERREAKENARITALVRADLEKAMYLKGRRLAWMEDRNAEAEGTPAARPPTEESDKETVTITKADLDAGLSERGGWSDRQIACLGENKRDRGWRKRLIGKVITRGQLRRFLSLRNAHIPGAAASAPMLFPDRHRRPLRKTSDQQIAERALAIVRERKRAATT